MLEVKGITKKYENLSVLENVSFEVERGKSLSIQGESGCGKTTLLMIIAGLLEADKGEIMFEGKPLDEEPCKRNVSMVFQNSTLWNNMTVCENILFPSSIKDKNERRREAERLAKAFGIEEILDRFPGEISGGQARRAAIARALAAKRDILLLDEPFSNLDKDWKEKTMEGLRELCNENCTVILVTHSREEADFFCDRHLYMEEGNLKEGNMN